MADLLIRNIDIQLKRLLQASARRHGRGVSEEAKALLKKALLETRDKTKMGDALLKLVPEKYRGNDLSFEIPGNTGSPPEFE
jgi:plasmid stability protein